MAMIYEDWCPVLVECRMRILKSGGNTDICLFALNWLECVGMNYQTHSNLVQGFCFFCRSLSHPSGQRGVCVCMQPNSTPRVFRPPETNNGLYGSDGRNTLGVASECIRHCNTPRCPDGWDSGGRKKHFVRVRAEGYWRRWGYTCRVERGRAKWNCAKWRRAW